MVPRFATLGRIPKGVWVLGGVSLLMDVSSEMIHCLLPLFMATTLGASVIIIGLIEGLAEATALILKVFSGAISDYVEAKVFAARRAMRWSPTSPRRRSAAPPTDYARRWIPSAPFSARCWRCC